MSFRTKLKQFMAESKLNQAQISKLTGIGRSAISQYVAGHNEPTSRRKREMAVDMGLDENFFIEIIADPEIQDDEIINLPVETAARLMGKSRAWIKQGLQDGVFPWGYAVKMKKWSYFISARKFSEMTGIEVKTK